MAVVRYRPNKAGLDHVLRDRRGPVALYTANIGRQVEGAARRRAPVKTGALKRSIGSRLVRSSLGGWNVEVSADTPYAAFVSDGTRPHTITGNPWLVFPGRDGRTVFVHSVNHPGTKPNRYLLDAMREVGLTPKRR